MRLDGFEARRRINSHWCVLFLPLKNSKEPNSDLDIVIREVSNTFYAVEIL